MMDVMKNIFRMMCGIAVAVSAQACSTMVVEDGVVESKYAGLSFKYHWGEDAVPDPLDSMYCIMGRVQYSHHYVLKTDNDGVVKCDNVATDENGISDASLFNSRFYVKPGEYTVCALRKPRKGVTIERIGDFASSTAVAFSDLTLKYVDTPKEELDELKNPDGSLIKWISNQGEEYPYFCNISSMEYEIKKNFVINSNTDVDMEFTPGYFTQRVVIPFQLRIKDGVEIENVLMEISGVVKERYLSKDVVIADHDGKNTGCVIVKPKLVSQNGDDLFYEAELNSFGLMPNRLMNSSVGPGLMHLAIYGKAENKTKRLSTTKNISRFLVETPTIEYDEVENVYRLISNDVRLKTDFKFSISAEQIMSDTEDGIEEWKDEDNNINGEI